MDGNDAGTEVAVARAREAGEILARTSESLGGLAAAEPPLQASVGLANLRPGLSAQGLYREADAAMYRAKQAGGHRIEVAMP